MWLLNKQTPDFRTISDFRKDNKKAITKVFKEFKKFCMGLKLFSKSYISIDGSKFKIVAICFGVYSGKYTHYFVGEVNQFLALGIAISYIYDI